LQPGDKIAFNLLKKEIAAVMRQSYQGINPDISQWKGQDIADFQEDLQRRVNGRLSEKWFYIHMKSPIDSLPRIDVLNMLSRYVSYSSWQDFIYKNNLSPFPQERLVRALSMVIRAPLLFIAVMAVVLAVVALINTQRYRVTFFDKVTGEPIASDKIRVTMLMANESPVNYTSGVDGDIVVRTNKGMISMVVTTPYYLPDTITRRLKKFGRNEKIGLDADSYALMISYFSESDLNAWEKRREQLQRIISDDALIYRSSGTNSNAGMELYNKKEFIDKLTMPSSSLRKIEILETRYLNDQIVLLRFRLKEENNE
jgi:hypothetical protein